MQSHRRSWYRGHLYHSADTMAASSTSHWHSDTSQAHSTHFGGGPSVLGQGAPGWGSGTSTGSSANPATQPSSPVLAPTGQMPPQQSGLKRDYAFRISPSPRPKAPAHSRRADHAVTEALPESCPAADRVPPSEYSLLLKPVPGVAKPVPGVTEPVFIQKSEIRPFTPMGECHGRFAADFSRVLTMPRCHI
jgi:hypothetical protein